MFDMLCNRGFYNSNVIEMTTASPCVRHTADHPQELEYGAVAYGAQLEQSDISIKKR